MTEARNLTEAERCPECGERIEPESRECAHCGHVLFDREPEPSIDGPYRQGEDKIRWDPIEALDDEGRLHEPPMPDFQDLEPVFEGTMSEVMTHRAALGARGYETYIRDDNTKVIDPFITGGYAFNVSLDAPKDVAPEIRAILAEIAGREPAREKTPEELEIERVDRMGRSVILCTIFLFTAPIAVVQALRYAAATSRLKRSRPDSVWVLICAVLSLSVCAFAVYVAYWTFVGTTRF